MTAQELFESEPIWKRCRKFDKWQLIHFAESYHRHVEHLEKDILKTEQTTEADKSDEQPCFKHDVKHRCFHCGKLIIFDDYSASWIHKRKWTVDDNGYYCDNNKPDIKYTATPNNGI